MKLSELKISLFSAVTLMLPLSGSAAAPYLQGRVTASNTLQGIDSVRVTSSHFRYTAFTDSNGDFTFERPSPLPEPDRTDSTFRYTMQLSARSPAATFIRSTDEQHTVALYNLNGKVLARSAFDGNRPFFDRAAPYNGIVLYRFDRYSTGKLLVIDNSSSGRIRSGTLHVQKPAAPHFAVDDTLYFFKQGYAAAQLAVTTSDVPLTQQLQREYWKSFDIHSHTILTDGTTTLDTMLAHCFGRYGLDVYANSEHGGLFATDTNGTLITTIPGYASAPSYYGDGYISRWFTLTTFAWPKILGQRKRYPEKSLLLGLEWNNPGHEHVSVGFIDDNDLPYAVSNFEYRFDANDPDTSRGSVMKQNLRTHSNAVAAVRWLQQNYPLKSYCFINHPSRENDGPNPVTMFRDFHNAAPDVFLGLEGMPGHQKFYIRGKYAQSNKPTVGGADPVIAAVGGLWDALLGEGRRLWIIVDSDFHLPVDQDFWPGEYAKTWVAATDTGLAAWLSGVRSGNMFAVHGDLINALSFTIDDGVRKAAMGSDLHTPETTLSLEIRFRSPAFNNHDDPVRVDHIDIIGGPITGIIDPSDTEAYSTPFNESTRLVARIPRDSITTVNGWNVIRTDITCNTSMYFRLRGTSLAAGTPGETDGEGNPLPDVAYANNEATAWKDLWFYSNPIFVYKN